MNQQILGLLRQVEAGTLSAEEAMLHLKMEPFEEVGNFAKLQLERAFREREAIRQALAETFPEVLLDLKTR